jgi:hypothetical protein
MSCAGARLDLFESFEAVSQSDSPAVSVISVAYES